jgi:hypothetical protein
MIKFGSNTHLKKAPKAKRPLDNAPSTPLVISKSRPMGHIADNLCPKSPNFRGKLVKKNIKNAKGGKTKKGRKFLN